MRAIAPLNVAALRVSRNDADKITPAFKGREAVFEDMPYAGAGSAASTGDQIFQPLHSDFTPANALGTGVHLHWRLPAYFRHGAQSKFGGGVAFPPTPNRWLVIRYLKIFDAARGVYGELSTNSWIVESDYLNANPPSGDPIVRPSVTAPLPARPGRGEQPFRYLGRALGARDWNPSLESPMDFLPSYRDKNGDPIKLTALGFVGPSFGAFYPECASVFGFWDHFHDANDVFEAITQYLPIRFKVSYQVVGWLNDAADDPLLGVEGLVRAEYDAYANSRRAQKLALERTPADVFVDIAKQRFAWSFRPEAISFRLKADQTLDQLDAPAGVLCAGIAQEIVWDSGKDPQSSFFLANPEAKSRPLTHSHVAADDPMVVWPAKTRLAIGATTIEALSALLKSELNAPRAHPAQLDDYELLLDALQLGLLRDGKRDGDWLAGLEESVHARSFSKFAGGHVWTLQNQKLTKKDEQSGGDDEAEPPAALVGALGALNAAQEAYDCARAALDELRKQLFMDWIRFVKVYVTNRLQNLSGPGDDGLTMDQLWAFVAASSGPSELSSVIDAGASAGVLAFDRDAASGEIIGLKPPKEGATLARAVWAQYEATRTAVAAVNATLTTTAWRLRATAAAPFWAPSDLVLLMEGDRIQPAPLGGGNGQTAMRTSGEALSRLTIAHGGAGFSLDAATLSGAPALPAGAPPEIAGLIGEAFLLTPMLADAAAEALAAQGGAANPAVQDRDGFTIALRAIQGGLSPLDGAPSQGLYEAQRAANAIPAANPSGTATGALAPLQIVFTNAAGAGWAPDPIAWTAQTALPAFSADRVDPFLPTSLVWRVWLDPLKRDQAGYSATNVSDYFQLDSVDYTYPAPNHGPPPFTPAAPLLYSGSIALSRRGAASLAHQIDSFLVENPDDPSADDLRRAKDAYERRGFLSQSLSGFNAAQTLRSYLPQVPVEDLMFGPTDEPTKQLKQAASADPDDDWVQGRFNSVAPISVGPLAQNNFGPLRAGFLTLDRLEIIDGFGQRMKLETSPAASDGAPLAVPSRNLTPAAGDTASAGKVFLPPRVLAATRLSFRWLSALRAKGGAPLEVSDRPASTPAIGWALPDNLDGRLSFYDSEGGAIGSFGVEQGHVKYRTVAGNAANLSDRLDIDIGPRDAPTIDRNLAALLWRIADASRAFLDGLLDAIHASEAFIQPAGHAQDGSLAALIGRPLALARVTVGLETSGRRLALNQADAKPGDPFPSDVAARRFDYAARERTSAADLDSVRFPLRLGELANIDDGLVGFLIEGPGEQPYDVIYCASATGSEGVVKPEANTLELTLNSSPITLTLLLDPRAPVHATTGVLPIAELRIPPTRYVRAFRKLAATFFTHPVLARRQALAVPLPSEAGYDWSWIAPGGAPARPLHARAVDGVAFYDFTPQTLLEGWLKLSGRDETPQSSTPDP